MNSRTRTNPKPIAKLTMIVLSDLPSLGADFGAARSEGSAPPAEEELSSPCVSLLAMLSLPLAFTLRVFVWHKLSGSEQESVAQSY